MCEEPRFLRRGRGHILEPSPIRGNLPTPRADSSFLAFIAQQVLDLHTTFLLHPRLEGWGAHVSECVMDGGRQSNHPGWKSLHSSSTATLGLVLIWTEVPKGGRPEAGASTAASSGECMPRSRQQGLPPTPECGFTPEHAACRWDFIRQKSWTHAHTCMQ